MPRLEILIAFLLVVSIAAVTINNNSPRELTITPGSGWQVAASDDRVEGGSSRASGQELSDSFRLRYDLSRTSQNPYATLTIRKPDGETIDLSWVERVIVGVRSDNKRQGFRFHIRNVEDFSEASDYTSRKYNEGLLRIDASAQEVALYREDFHVPLWWAERYKLKNADARPAFDRVDSIELTTIAREGKGTLEITGVRITGHWIAPAELVSWLLGMWMSTFFVVLIARVWQLRTELSHRAEAEQELIDANDELASQSKLLSEIACRDSLTGLFNRRGIRDSISNLMEDWQTDNKRFAVVTFDIDRFKQINDSKGHAFGDDVLCQLSRIAIGELRGRDLIARWGGEEFLIVCSGATETAAANLAERLRKKFAANELGFTCSFGVSEVAEGDEFDAILERADLALYKAKSSGRNQVVVFDSVANAMDETLPEFESSASSERSAG